MKREFTRIVLDRQAAQTMIHEVPATRPSASRLVFAWSRGLALTCFLLVISAADGVLRSASANEEKPPAKGVAGKGVVGAKTAAAPAAAPTAEQQLLLRRRLAIAEMLEENIYYRTIHNIRLFDAVLAGPFEYTSIAIFTGARITSTYYCVSAKLDYPLFPIPKTAQIEVRQSSSGYERLLATGQSPLVCGDAKYGPFPEFEQARARRRAALGKTN